MLKVILLLSKFSLGSVPGFQTRGQTHLLLTHVKDDTIVSIRREEAWAAINKSSTI